MELRSNGKCEELLVAHIRVNRCERLTLYNSQYSIRLNTLVDVIKVPKVRTSGK